MLFVNFVISVFISINANVYIDMQTEFKNRCLAYLITFLTPGKRVRMHGLECPYGAYIFTAGLFFRNHYVRGIFYTHFVHTQHL